jgi:hypothetical protein
MRPGGAAGPDIEHLHAHAGAGQQEAEHHAGRPAAGDDTARADGVCITAFRCSDYDASAKFTAAARASE